MDVPARPLFPLTNEGCNRNAVILLNKLRTTQYILTAVLIVYCRLSCAQAAEVQKFSTVPKSETDSAPLIQKAILSMSEGQTLQIEKGTYYLDSPVWVERVKHLRLVGGPGVVFKKRKGFQYMFAFIGSEDVTISGLSFEGMTPDRNKLVWGDDGVYFGSCRGSTVESCTFHDFGDSAVRITSSLEEGRVDSWNGTVRDSYFENIGQITSTQGMEGNYGGTEGMTIKGNTLKNLKASIKLAARAPTAGGIISNNRILGSLRDGVEIESVSDVVIEGNSFEDIARTAVILNINDNTPRDAPGFPWNNVIVRKNSVARTGSGIEVYLKPYLDASEFDMNGLEIVDNHFDTITGDANSPVIYLGNTTKKKYLAPRIEGNVFKNAGNRREFTVTGPR